MKKQLLTLAMLGSLLASAPMVQAHESDDPELNVLEHKMHRHHERKRFQMMRALSALDLSDEQKATIKSIKEGNKETAKANRETMKSLRKQIRDALQADVVDEGTVKALSAQAADLKAEQMIKRANIKKQIFATLTDEQKAKLEKMKQKRLAKMKRWHDENE